jgi:general secretion pathway protein I
MTRSESGFTLIETLVAFAIATLLLAAIFPALSGSLKTVGRADSEHRAVLWAESLIDAMGAMDPPQMGESSGSIDATTRWRAHVSPLATAPGANGGPGLSAYELTVEVTVDAPHGAARTSLTTVRLAKSAP